MKIKNLNNSAFTLLEVLLAAVIFIISVAGVFATLNAVRGPVAAKENALSAAIVGQQVLNYLRSQVGTPTYYHTACAVTSPCPASTPGIDCSNMNLVLGTHVVPWGSLPPGISSPANLQALNTNGLCYTVTCADTGIISCNPVGSGAGATGTALDQSRQVALNITSS